MFCILPLIIRVVKIQSSKLVSENLPEKLGLIVSLRYQVEHVDFNDSIHTAIHTTIATHRGAHRLQNLGRTVHRTKIHQSH